MIGTKRIERLETEIEKIKTKYNPKTIEDLIKVAMNEYGVVNVIKTPLVCDASITTKNRKNFYIFYYASFKPHEMHTLGHELGHIASGHFNRIKFELSDLEDEADYFSAKLCGISLIKYKIYENIDAILSFKEMFMDIFRHEREIERLEQMGVYQFLK